MAKGIRQRILEGLVSTLGAIKATDDYRTTVQMVEVAIRDACDVPKRERPYIGIAPQQADGSDLPSRCREVVWPMDLICYIDVLDRSQLQMIEQASNYVNDVRRALYADPKVGVDDDGDSERVHFTTITREFAGWADPESRKDKTARVLIGISVKFSESVTSA